MSRRTKQEIDSNSTPKDTGSSLVFANADGAVTEEYNFEMSEEVKDRIEHTQNKHCYISEDSLSDLKVLGKPGAWCRFVKRAIDILASFFAIMLLLLPALIIMLVVFIDDPGKVFFRQYRVGKDGKRFKLYKFRTMKKEAPKYMSTMEFNDPDKYITRVGRFLRKSSLDEIPQLFNVLKGDMSIVGPRPLISDEYEIHQMRTKLGVYSIRPGVTGLAQINGRDTVEPSAKVRWDHKYLETMSFKTDLKIIFATIPKVFGHVGFVEGYSIEKAATESEKAEEPKEGKEEDENVCV